ncbi:MAG TPA: gliding motility-associated C-terminal domain-containing protein, partial [Chitinophagaceae bacterium]|nr:gliding motility-associated C-terminal domain-containing protein [Chitinophagaceae bacterium]
APRTTSFIFSAFDTRGCPKAGTDTVLVTWMPRLQIRAGNDTAVVTGQPLQLAATGGIRYNWSPSFALSAIDIANPVAVFNAASTGFQYQVTGFDSAGCAASATVLIKVYQTAPTVFVPTAFTPNNDGRNDRLRPIGAGIGEIKDFSIYNRWGELVFSTRQNGIGWDGNKNGLPQPTGTYVWQVSATDYRGRPYFQKGIFTLIR